MLVLVPDRDSQKLLQSLRCVLLSRFPACKPRGAKSKLPWRPHLTLGRAAHLGTAQLLQTRLQSVLDSQNMRLEWCVHELHWVTRENGPDDVNQAGRTGFASGPAFSLLEKIPLSMDTPASYDSGDIPRVYDARKSSSSVQQWRYLAILDFEATCESKKKTFGPQEIIEFPVVFYCKYRKSNPSFRN